MLANTLLMLVLSASVGEELDFVSAISLAQQQVGGGVFLEGNADVVPPGFEFVFAQDDQRVLVAIPRERNTKTIYRQRFEPEDLAARKPLLDRLTQQAKVSPERALAVARARVKDASVRAIDAKIDAKSRLVWEVDMRSSATKHEVDVEAVTGEIVAVIETPRVIPSPITFDFDSDRVGSLPKGFRVDGTQQEGPLATWEIVGKDSESDENHVLRMTRPNHQSGQTFNLCWSPSLEFREGSISVKLRAESGQEDQGGGLIWHVIDANNYCLARFNPLESNLRIYRVEDGKRTQLSSMDIPGKSHVWYELRVDHVGYNDCVTLDSVNTIRLHSEGFPTGGGVGLWTKADAATSFDDLRIEPREP